jgi:hypothetical protein
MMRRITNKASRFVHQWEEEARQACEEEECRKMGRHWVDNKGNQVMDDEDENNSMVTSLVESRHWTVFFVDFINMQGSVPHIALSVQFTLL